FAGFILRGVYKTFRSSVRLFLQGTPESVDLSTLSGEMQTLPGVQNVHDLHVWSMDGHSHVLTVHLVVSKTSDIDQQNLLKETARSKARHYGITHATIEIETDGTDCETKDCVKLA